MTALPSSVLPGTTRESTAHAVFAGPTRESAAHAVFAGTTRESAAHAILAGPARGSSARGALAAAAIACALSAMPACGFAVKHPAITAGVVAGSLGFATCKLASDNYAACGLVAGGAGAFLGLVTAAALWLGGDGNSTALDEQAQPVPEDDQPPMPVALPPDSPSANPPSANPPSANPPSASPPSASPPSANRPSASPPSANRPSASPPSASPPSANPPPMSPP